MGAISLIITNHDTNDPLSLKTKEALYWPKRTICFKTSHKPQTIGEKAKWAVGRCNPN